MGILAFFNVHNYPTVAIAINDLILDAGSFSRLDLPVRRIFVAEDETNFLAFLPQPGAIVIFGTGYSWVALAHADWLRRCTIHYWGDIDTHSFAILDQLRGHFPHLESLLTDRATSLAHEVFWGRESDSIHHDLHDNRIRLELRLEQELIGFDRVRSAVECVR